jgi:hypothetical protein
MTAVRALCVPSASGHKNRGLPKTTSPENPWLSAEDRGFEPRMVLPPNRISSAALRLPGRSRHDRDCAKSQARRSGKARITPGLTGNARNVLRVRTRNGHARTRKPGHREPPAAAKAAPAIRPVAGRAIPVSR